MVLCDEMRCRGVPRGLLSAAPSALGTGSPASTGCHPELCTAEDGAAISSGRGHGLPHSEPGARKG